MQSIISKITFRTPPSSYNAQQWRFIYARRNTENWDKFLNLLTDDNKIWAKNAALLVVVISRKNFEFNEKPSVIWMYVL